TVAHAYHGIKANWQKDVVVLMAQTSPGGSSTILYSTLLAAVLRPHPRKASLPPVLDSPWTMAETFDISLDSLAGCSVAPQNIAVPGTFAPSTAGATFFLETFGCQMNDHDSEKVAGLLLSRGYRQVESPQAASLLPSTPCGLAEKAAQKVFSRLGEYREKQSEAKVIGVLGCVAQ